MSVLACLKRMWLNTWFSRNKVDDRTVPASGTLLANGGENNLWSNSLNWVNCLDANDHRVPTPCCEIKLEGLVLTESP